MPQVDVSAWASAYIAAEGLPSEAKHESPNWWAIERFMNLYDRDQAEQAWLVILEILSRRPSPAVVGMLAAGPLEDLVEEWGPEFIDRIELEARRNPAFRHLLGGVWRSSTNEVWSRIENARGHSW
jgi:hypothetical protein